MSIHRMYESIRTNILEEEDQQALGIGSEEISEKPEITPELVDELIAPTGIEDKEQFAKGLQEELEHYDSVNKDITIIAKIVADHLKKIPNYYSLLEHLEQNQEEETEEIENGEEIPEPAVEVSQEAPIDSKPDAEGAVTSEGKKDDKHLDDSPEALKSLYEQLATAEKTKNAKQIEEIKAKIAKIKK